MCAVLFLFKSKVRGILVTVRYNFVPSAHQQKAHFVQEKGMVQKPHHC